jgi:phosphodiesterase/alkaline phosphatase D-like protein
MPRLPKVSRRQLLAGSAALAAAGKISPAAAAAPKQKIAAFVSGWKNDVDRVWLGADYWAAPLQDWRVKDGAAELMNAAPNRVIHLLTRQLGDERGGFEMSVRISRSGGAPLDEGSGSAGFRFGIRGPLGDYRNALLFGKGLDAGLTCDGRLFLGALNAKATRIELGDAHTVELRLAAQPEADGYRVRLSVHVGDDDKLLGETSRDDVTAEQLVGNVALVANFGGVDGPGPKKKAAAAADPAATAGNGLFRFADWTVSGEKVESHEEHAFGPILFTQYTLSRGTLKLTAQMAPVEDAEPAKSSDDSPVVLEMKYKNKWQKVDEATLDPQTRLAAFRIDNWDGKADVPYRVVYDLKTRDGKERSEWSGVIRKEPLAKPTLTVADLSCNIHSAFPNDRYVEHTRRADPDFLAFVGDQFYESTAGYGVTQAPHEAAVLDYLRKWYIHGWTWRELLKDRPSIALPDDHDVYHGNLWGEGGVHAEKSIEAGGYRMPSAWVEVVHRTQTSHHPDPADPSPTATGLTQYYGRLVYGGVDFILLADRMYKTGPEGAVPPTGGRPDHVTDPNFDPKTVDLPGLSLLGEKQEKFLEQWAGDRLPNTVKAVVSQTIFTAMATTHGGPNGRLVADYDTNGWPQTPRNRAVRAIRKACAIHIAGDQHLPAVVQYGIDAPRDGSYAFAGPATNCGYPRWWEPSKPGANRVDGESELCGDFIDSFGNHLRVVAVVNQSKKPRPTVLEQMTDKASGLGLVKFHKSERSVTIQCWPYDVDPTAADAKQFPGWPVTIDLPSA